MRHLPPGAAIRITATTIMRPAGTAAVILMIAAGMVGAGSWDACLITKQFRVSELPWWEYL